MRTRPYLFVSLSFILVSCSAPEGSGADSKNYDNKFFAANDSTTSCGVDEGDACDHFCNSLAGCWDLYSQFAELRYDRSKCPSYDKESYDYPQQSCDNPPCESPNLHNACKDEFNSCGPWQTDRIRSGRYGVEECPDWSCTAEGFAQIIENREEALAACTQACRSVMADYPDAVTEVADCIAGVLGCSCNDGLGYMSSGGFQIYNACMDSIMRDDGSAWFNSSFLSALDSTRFGTQLKACTGTPLGYMYYLDPDGTMQCEQYNLIDDYVRLECHGDSTGQTCTCTEGPKKGHTWWTADCFQQHYGCKGGNWDDGWLRTECGARHSIPCGNY